MDNFKAALVFRFERILANINRYKRFSPLKVNLQTTEKNDKLWLRLSDEQHTQSASLPVPYQDECGNLVIGRRVVRAVGTWHHMGKEYTYWQLLTWLLTGRIETAFPGVSKRSQLERLIQSFDSAAAPLAFRSFQNLVDGLVNRLPLAGTPYEAWAMCNRVVFLDPNFDTLAPKKALEYQVSLNKRYFPWTSIGLSDSGMCNNNLLKVDLRKYTPFGLKHHNPMRNLFQTLGMKGEEPPLVLTQSAATLAKEKGIERRGWNLMTCFLDLPANFEDQLIVDNRHLDKFTLENRRLVCYGQPKVVVGDELSEGATISIEPDGKQLRWWVKSDRAIVTNVTKEQISFNGQETTVALVYIETKHIFKEGIKLTNRHGNKGVVSFADCGNMFDQGRQKEVPIDLIVSAKTIGKRRNYGQILEALLSLLQGRQERVVLKDNTQVEIEKFQDVLRKRGYRPDGSSPVKTQWGEFNAVCGWGFWGLIKNPENQLWTKAEVTATDSRERRRAGIKVSHIELKGLTTIFGAKNPVVDEILSYQQGVPDVLELVEILEVLRGRFEKHPILDWSAIKPLQQTEGFFHPKAELSRTIADETVYPEGFLLELPFLFHVFTPENRWEEPVEQLLPKKTAVEGAVLEGGRNVFIDKIYVPSDRLRGSWQHSAGLWGLSDIGGYLNNIIVSCHKTARKEAESDVLLHALVRYFKSIAKRLSTKRGEISTYCLAVRYPHSAKATATLSKGNLPANTLEIHENMAADLRVRDGDYVIAERFPCLGFKSLRIQRVKVTADPQCRYVIRVSGNSLVSQGLDFDGDVLFLIALRSAKAKQALAQEFIVPDITRKRFIDEANACKLPSTGAVNLNDFSIETFSLLTKERQAEIVKGLTGLKRGTGTIVALAYNVMRIIEGGVGYEDKDISLAMEVILDKVANSVFGQKHAGISLEDRCREAICTADLEDMLKMGFPKAGSQRLCELLRKEALSVGVTDLKAHFKRHLDEGRSSIINQIVREKHKFYFATRADLYPTKLLEHLDAPAQDLTSHLWYRGKRRHVKEALKCLAASTEKQRKTSSPEKTGATLT